MVLVAMDKSRRSFPGAKRAAVRLLQNPQCPIIPDQNFSYKYISKLYENLFGQASNHEDNFAIA